MRPTTVFCHESAEEVTTNTAVSYLTIIVDVSCPFSIGIAVPTVVDSCMGVAVLLFPHCFHGTAAIVTLYAADRYFCAFPHD